MTKQKLMLKLSAYKVALAVLAVVLLASGGLAVKAKSYFDWGNVEDKVASQLVGTIVMDEPVEETLGAVATDYKVSKLMDVNGDQTYHITQDFKTGTTTLILIPNPFLTASSSSSASPVLRTDGSTQWLGATSTVDFAVVQVVGVATSSMVLTCGSSADATSGAIARNFLITDTIPTSTPAYVRNNLTTGDGAAVGGGSTSTIMMTPTNPYFKCLATTVDYADTTPISQSSRTLTGSIMVRFNNPRP